MTHSTDAWLAPVEYTDEQSTDLIVYCGDGRFGTAIESFAKGRLGLPRCARLVVPGGPVCLAGETPPFYEVKTGAAAQFYFLVDALKIQRVHLIAHDRCAFYIQKLEVPEANLRQRQIEDLKKIASRVRHDRPNLAVDSWVAEVRNDTVAFLETPTQ